MTHQLPRNPRPVPWPRLLPLHPPRCAAVMRVKARGDVLDALVCELEMPALIMGDNLLRPQVPDFLLGVVHSGVDPTGMLAAVFRVMLPFAGMPVSPFRAESQRAQKC